MNIITDNVNLELIKKKGKEIYWSVPFIFTCIWILDAIWSIFNIGFTRIDIPYLISMAVKLIVIGLNAFFIMSVFLRDKKQLFRLYKTFVGYGIVVIYVFYSLPRLSWSMAGLVDQAVSFRLWCYTFISTMIPLLLYVCLWYKKTQLYWGLLKEEDLDKDKRKEKKKQKVNKPKWLVVIENIDTIVQAILIAIVIQVFFFQNYQIPTLSMAPMFLMGDRVFVNKLVYGPRIPLTDWKLPSPFKPKTGDVVVFESPEYSQDSVFKRIFNQFVFMVTLGQMNLDVDENNDPRKQFIVKRMIAGPGEKIRMIDSVVYIKKKGEKEYKVLKKDKEVFAVNDFYYAVSKSKAETAISDEIKSFLEKWDNWKKKISIDELAADIKSEFERLENKRNKTNRNKWQSFADRMKPFWTDSLVRSISGDRVRRLGHGFDYFLQDMTYIEKFHKQYQLELKYFYDIMVNEDQYKKFKEYVFSALNSQDERLDKYHRNGKKLNYYIKKLFLQKYNIFIKLIEDKTSLKKYSANAELKNTENNLVEILTYIGYDMSLMSGIIPFYDSRNFPEFPEGKNNYLKKDEYFLMGDNRFNSLDFRYDHSPGIKYRKLDKTDMYSVMYRSKIEPYALKMERILGKAVVKFWPPERINLVK